jgi:SAM-dependent methyltransferase
MASSFIDQTPTIIHLLQKLKPKSILDIGKGFGKYGFLIHEYVGIDNTKKLNPAKSLRELSNIVIDAVEVDEDLMLPHLSQLYNNIYFGDVLQLYNDLPVYDLVLMIDIIEHIDKEKALVLLQYFLNNGSKIIIATPKDFFEQELYESEFEHHVSHWTINDFKSIGYCASQNINAGTVYLLSNENTDIRGFGNSFIKKIRRIARAIKNEF